MQIEVETKDMELTGLIVRRRSLGKYLAFADIQKDGGSSTDIVQVAFRRTSPTWNSDLDDTFPTKTSSLPYGAKVELQLCPTSRETQKQGTNNNGPSLEVKSWRILVNPLESAQQAAKQGDGDDDDGGISCSVYLQERSKTYLSLPKPVPTLSNEERKSKKEERISQSSNNNDLLSDGCHGNKKAKALRAKLFASWLIDKFGDDYLRQGGGVLDVAGGKGQLSVELSTTAQISCTIIDPLLRKRGKGLLPKEVKRLAKANAPHPNHISKPFYNNDDFLKGERELVVQRASCLVGLHPDECTEDILDVALRYNKSVAIVPCCVFPCLFPMRIVAGKPVRSYEDFLRYLLTKDERLQQETLNFEGKNEVIFYKCD